MLLLLLQWPKFHLSGLILVDMQGCILDCAEMMDVVLKKGSWYSYADQRFVFCAYCLHSNKRSIPQHCNFFLLVRCGKCLILSAHITILQLSALIIILRHRYVGRHVIWLAHFHQYAALPIEASLLDSSYPYHAHHQFFFLQLLWYYP